MSTDTSGPELRELREKADLTSRELAVHMGVHSSRVSQIEALARVTPRTARRYLEALALSQLAKTTEHAAQAS
jgi:transcriptional regulator with XRE-family HTH domain